MRGLRSVFRTECCMAAFCSLDRWSIWVLGTVSLLSLSANAVAQSPASPFGAPQQAISAHRLGQQPQSDPAPTISQGLATAAPLTLLQKPPVPPSVSFQNGLLSIDAPNSNLADVLSAVRRATGAVIEGGGGQERVVVHLGPGRPSDVLSTLLSGSHYNYVLLGTPQTPGAVTRIMLTLREGGDQLPAPVAVANSAPVDDSDDDSREEAERQNRRRAAQEEAGQGNAPQPAPFTQPPVQPTAQQQPNQQQEQE